MVRLLILALLVVLALVIWRRVHAAVSGSRTAAPLTTDLVRCDRCGHHVPREQAAPTADGWRCDRHVDGGDAP